jgi:2-iminobutanoate/2-iminopropanoate deaminase
MRKPLTRAVALLLLCASVAFAADKRVVIPAGAKPSGNWSYGMLVDGTLYVSGMAGEDANGKVPGTFEAEMKQALDNIDGVLKAAGMTSADVVSVQVYLTDASLFQRMNAVYTTYFKDPRPARTTVIVAKLVGDGHVEIATTARK